MLKKLALFTAAAFLLTGCVDDKTKQREKAIAAAKSFKESLIKVSDQKNIALDPHNEEILQAFQNAADDLSAVDESYTYRVSFADNVSGARDGKDGFSIMVFSKKDSTIRGASLLPAD